MKKDICKEIRKTILTASYKSKACHIGSALSCVEILVDIYFNKLKKNDIFIFSKASGVVALYAVLAEKGIIPKKKVAYYLKKYPLPNRRVPGVTINGGSLGHGLPQAIGMALMNKKRNIYILMSDGELQVGTTWECLLFIKQHKIENVKIYVDNNKFQACGAVENILGPPYDFLKKRGFKIIETIKGKGIDFMENRFEWHYLNLSEIQLKEALDQLK